MNILKKIKKDISKAKIVVNDDKTATIKYNKSYSKGLKYMQSIKKKGEK